MAVFLALLVLAPFPAGGGVGLRWGSQKAGIGAQNRFSKISRILNFRSQWPRNQTMVHTDAAEHTTPKVPPACHSVKQRLHCLMANIFS
jgi:hypothetical protein